LPPTVQGILAARIDRQPSEHKHLLQTLAVMGRESSLALISQVASLADTQLQQIIANLEVGEFIFEQPAATGVEYVFKHALTQEVAYNSLLIERRKQLHERTGKAVESLFADRLDDHLTQLAYHYGHSGNADKAIEYLGRAGQQAMQRSAHADAVNSLQTAFDLLEKLPGGPERSQRELSLQLALAPGLIALKGWGAPEVLRSYTRARELCERLGDPPELSHVLFGLWTVHFLSDELLAAYELGQQMLHRAQTAHDPVLLMFAHEALGDTSYQMGELLLAREHLEKAIVLYDREHHRPLALRFTGLDSEVQCLSYLSYTLWELGYPDQALRCINEAVALAREISHPYSLAFGEDFRTFLHLYRREASASLEPAGRLAALCAEHGFSGFSPQIPMLKGWAIAVQGHNEEGIAHIQEGLAAMRAAGMELARPLFLTRLAECYMDAGRVEDGLNTLAKALSAKDEKEDRQQEAERYRLKGELLLRQDPSNAAEAEKCFEQALESARKQHAKIFELRATISMARLLAQRSQPDTARKMLADIYNWFTEGFDTADLKDAQTLLDGLAG
jgi:predicted ATPase